MYHKSPFEGLEVEVGSGDRVGTPGSSVGLEVGAGFGFEVGVGFGFEVGVGFGFDVGFDVGAAVSPGSLDGREEGFPVSGNVST